MDELTHTHYSPYAPPHQAPGTLMACHSPQDHNFRDSEISADYLYAPRLEPSASTGLPPYVEQAAVTLFMERRSPDIHPTITAASVTDSGYEIEIAMRSPDNSGWHAEIFLWFKGLGLTRVAPNPHPGYPHTPPWCANCGY